MLWKPINFSTLQGKQVCPGRLHWIAMINAEQKVETTRIGKAIVHLPNRRKARGHLAFLRSVRLASAASPMWEQTDIVFRCPGCFGPRVLRPKAASARAVFEDIDAMFCAFRLWDCTWAAIQVMP
jgi:hypothetical protein